MLDDLCKKAHTVLENNYRQHFTIPCEGLYPFQWNWDSGFIALGWMYLDLERAFTEIRSLLSGQWKNGMIPHIIFHNPSDTYFPGPEVQASHLSLQAPAVPTSGITQPPVLGFVLEEIYAYAKEDPRTKPFIAEVYAAAYQYHHYLYTQRDIHQEGLVYIQHNWESGTDNSPVWDGIWETLDSPEYELERQDIKQAAITHRPSNREYQHYIHLIELFKQWKYDDALVAKHSPFLVQDPLFNAMLIKSNESLITLGKLLDKTAEVNQLTSWNTLAKRTYNQKLFDPALNAYIYYDLRKERPINMVTSSSFTALFAGIPTPEMAKKLIGHLNNGKFAGKSNNNYLCASFNPEHSAFEPERYWRGPIWINLNWLIFRGLIRYDAKKIANRLKNHTLFFVEKYGFYEYFDPRKAIHETLEKGYGGNNFSWTAALVIDLLSREV